MWVLVFFSFALISGVLVQSLIFWFTSPFLQGVRASKRIREPTCAVLSAAPRALSRMKCAGVSRTRQSCIACRYGQTSYTACEYRRRGPWRLKTAGACGRHKQYNERNSRPKESFESDSAKRKREELILAPAGAHHAQFKELVAPLHVRVLTLRPAYKA